MKTAIALLVLLSACTYPGADSTQPPETTTLPGSTVSNPAQPSETTVPPASPIAAGEFIPGQAFIEATSVFVAESFPMQLSLQVRGQLPTPCHELVWEVESSPGRFDVTIESRIELGETEGGTFEVYVNGELFETLDI